MKLSTSFLHNALRTSALVAAVGVASFMFDASAAYKAYTFKHNGIVYKTGTKEAQELEVQVQKAATTPTVGDDLTAPGVYKGEIVIPYKFTFQGKEYTVVKIGTHFAKNNEITSVVIEEGHTALDRGVFMNDSNLVSVKLPSTLKEWKSQVFYNCVSLTEISIPGGIAAITDTQFSGCKNLAKLTLEEGPTPIEITTGGFTDGGLSSLTELTLNRQIVETTVAAAPFRGLKTLSKVTIGGTMKKLYSSTFENCTGLTNVTFNVAPESMGTAVFANTGLTSFDFPASITSIPQSTFAACSKLTTVKLAEGLQAIEPMAFQNSAIANIEFPAGMTSIGQLAFSGTPLAGELNFKEGMVSVGIQAFANTKLTKVSFPASFTTIGDGAFMGCDKIASYTVDAANAALKSDASSTYVYTADGKKLICFAPASTLASISQAFEAVAPYACFKAANLKSVDFGNCKEWNDYCLAETGISTLAVKGNVGRYVAKGSALTELTVDNAEIPFGIAMDCKQLNKVTLVRPVTVVKQDAFNGCSALETLDLGNIVAILEANCFANSGIKTLNVAAAVPAGMAEGVFTAESGITVNVPVDFVADYKAADGWKLLNIVGDANMAAGPTDMGMPNGLYYAGEDGNIHGYYADGGSKYFEVGGAPHTFQLVQFKNRIYGASAGKKFVYTGTSATDGDGKLYYLSQVGGNLFQAVVLDNYGLNAYKDPFGLYIYGEDLFVNDRNVAIRKIPASGIALDAATFPSWMENNWMGWYNNEWSYGCIKAGWNVTKGDDGSGNEIPEYWLGIKYNGNGIYRFHDGDIGAPGATAPKPANSVFINKCTPIFTTFYIDEANQHMYIYVETTAGTEETMTRGGLYRIEMEKLLANPDPAKFSDLEPVLVDGAPVKYEGTAANEHVGISQLSPDEKGEYLYWCYRAPTQAEAEAQEAQSFDEQKAGKYWWAEKYDAANPLHQSGIKRIKLGEAQPKVEMVAPGHVGYGVVPVNFEGSTTPALEVETIVKDNANDAIVINGDVITVEVDAVVSIYALNGTMVSYKTVAAGEGLSVANLPAGAYIVSAALADGNNAVAKLVK